MEGVAPAPNSRLVCRRLLQQACAILGRASLSDVPRLEAVAFTSLAELPTREAIVLSYITRVLRLTLLAPDIVDAILAGRQGDGIDLTALADPFPFEWEAQRRHFSFGRLPDHR